jgi:glycosyltransferase involved in cell wall biosynthesis
LKKLKILHIVTTLELGGAEKQLSVLVRHQVNQGHNVFILFLKGENRLQQKLESAGVFCIEHLSMYNPLVQVFKLRALLRNLDLDVIHAHLPRAELIARLARSRRILFGVSRHNSEAFWPKAPSAISNLLSRWVVSQADFVIAISKSVETFLFNDGQLPARTAVSVVHYGFDDELKTRPVPLEVTNQLHAICVARLVKQKNHEQLFRSIALLSPKERPLLTLLGKGPLYEDLRKLELDLAIESSLTWIESHENPSALMASQELLILTSNYEGFGLVLLEAMQVGLPIIASNCAAAVEVLGQEYPGLYDLNSDQNLVEKLKEFRDLSIRVEAQKYLTKRLLCFSPRNMANEIETIYRKCYENK